MAMFVKPPKTKCIKCIFCARGKRRTDSDLRSGKVKKQKYCSKIHTPRQPRLGDKRYEMTKKKNKKAQEKSESSETLKSPQVMNSFLNQFSGAAIFQTSSCGSNKAGKLIRWDLTSRCASITETSASPDDCIIFNIYAINVQFVSRKWREIITSNFRAIHYGQTTLVRARAHAPNVQRFD